MLKAHHEDHNTCEIQSSQIVQNSKQTLLHKLLNLKTFFTNYFYSKPFSQFHFKPSSQTSWALNLPCKKNCFSHIHIIKKTQDVGGNSFDLELRSNFEFAPGHKHTKPPKNCSHKYNLSPITFFGNVWTSHLELLLFLKSISD